MAAASAVLLTLSLAAPVPADATPDQSVPSSGVAPQTTYFGMAQMAQTFTPSASGQLDRVSLYLGAPSLAHPTFRLEIWTVDTSKAALTPVGATPSYQFQFGLPNNAQKGWQTLDLVPSVHVDAQRQYALVVTATSFPLQLRWYYMNPWSLAGANLWLCCPWTKDTARDFDFQAYLAGATTPPPPPVVNLPPALDPPTTAALRVPEGTQPSNTGHYSDPEGDAVSFTASTGTVTWTATTWTWTGTASDEGLTQTVTVTGSDNHNPGVGVNFSLEVFAVEPTVTITPTQVTAAALGTATTVNEGKLLSFTGAAHSAWPADDATLTYEWSVTKDGAAYPVANNAAASFSFTPDDEGTYVITLAAQDEAGKPGRASVSANVLDVLPTATITAVTPALMAPKIVVPYENVSFSGTFADPGTGDTHTATWRFGDGTSASGWNVTHYYTDPGAYTVTLEVHQGDDPEFGTATATVTVLNASLALGKISAYVQGLSGLNSGQKNSLSAKLDAASASYARGDTKTAGNQLNAFLNELAAYTKTQKISPADADNLSADVRAVKASLGTYNRFLDLWPLGL